MRFLYGRSRLPLRRSRLRFMSHSLGASVSPAFPRLARASVHIAGVSRLRDADASSRASTLYITVNRVWYYDNSVLVRVTRRAFLLVLPLRAPKMMNAASAIMLASKWHRDRTGSRRFLS